MIAYDLELEDIGLMNDRAKDPPFELGYHMSLLDFEDVLQKR